LASRQLHQQVLISMDWITVKKQHNSLVPRRQSLLMLSALVFVIGMFPLAAQAQDASSQDSGPRRALEIITKAQRQIFEVEVASTREQRARGLMFRKAIPERDGMLFDFGRDQEIRMWMKDTLIPLDMIFIESDGRILRIEQNAEPESLRLISSGGQACAVLEVKAGTATKFGISVGDRVTNLSTDQ
jgi:uncharacterized membrane protein (UPF0127 family)